MSELTEEIRLVERIECAKEVKAEADRYRVAAGQAKEDGRDHEATSLYACATALYKMAEALCQRSLL
jgi:hypothetical protein